MTERSSKGLTGATCLAGIASAVLLTAIGCVKPSAATWSSAEPLRAGPAGAGASGGSNPSPMHFSGAASGAPTGGGDAPPLRR